MASGGRPAPETSASEIRSVRRPGESPDESLGETVLRCLLPPPPRNVSLPAAIRRSFPEACLRGAVSLPEPSWTRPTRGAMRPRPRAARRACGWGAESRYRFPRGPLPRARSSSSRAHGTRPGSTCTRHQVEICEAFQEVVLGLLRVENIFDFSQTTFNLALTIFSRLIVSVKIKKCLLHCVTITSLRLAAKVNEEEEVCIPGSSFRAAFEV
nr:cyclin-I2 [Globicephala melas]